MGNKKSHLTKDEMVDYESLTYLNASEILHAFDRFKQLDKDAVNEDKFTRISSDILCTLPELQNNPFADRIIRIFSFERDDKWSFEDFLDMVSVFNVRTPPQTKAEYAFRIYDFDEDGFLSASDLKEVVMRLSGHSSELDDSEMELIIENVLEESDLDGDGLLAVSEFQHSLMKSPNFTSSFTIRM